MTETTRGPGRPREAEVDERILDAALRLMREHGFVRMSMDQVAEVAGVTKPTIYRRYASKEHLAMAALAASRDHSRPPLTGDTRIDLIAELQHFQRGISRPFGMAMIGTVLAEEKDTPQLLASFREHLVQPRRQRFREILEQARARDELKGHANIELAINMLVGAFYAQYLSGQVFAEDWAEQVVAFVLASLR